MYRMYKEDDCWECQQNKFKKGGAKGSDKKWIQKAVKGMRKDKPCTGSKFGGPSCPPGTKRYNLAKVFREMAAKKKKEMGGQSAPMNMSENIGQNNINYFTNVLKDNATQAMQQNMLSQVAQQEMMPNMYLGGEENIFGYNPDKVNEYDNYLNIAKNQKRFNIGNFVGSLANRMDADAAYANWWNETQMQPIEKLTTKLNRKQIKEDIKRGGLQEEIARDYRKEFNKAAAKNRWAGFKITMDKLNPFTPNPEIPQTQYFTNTQTQQNQYGGTINYNDMNYNGYYNMPMYNQGGMKNYVYQGQDTGMTAEEFYQYQLETEGPFILPDGTDTGMSRAQFVDMQSQQMPEMQQMFNGGEHTFNPYYTDEEYNQLPTDLKKMADDQLKRELQTNAYNKLRGMTAAFPTAQTWYQNLDENKRPDVSLTAQQNIALAGKNQLPGQQDNVGYLNTMIGNQDPAMAKLMFPGIEQDAAGNWFYPAQKAASDSTTTEDVTETEDEQKKKKSTATKTTNTQTQNVNENVAAVENTAEILENNTEGASDAAGANDGTSGGAESTNTGANNNTGTGSGTGSYQETPIYYPSQQIGYMGVPVMGGNNLMPGYTLKNKYVPGGYGLMPIAYNAAQTYLDKNEVKDYKKGLIPALFGSRRITTTTFKHNILTPEQQNQLFQIEMRRRGYNPDGTSITGGAGNSADAEKAAADAATVVEQVSKDEAEKAAAERAAQGLPPETATDQSNIPTDQEIIPTPSDSKKSQMPITSALSYKFYGSEDPLDAEQQQVKKQEQQTMLTDDLGPSAFTTENLTFNPNTETYTIDDLVQEQNNPNTTGNNRNVIAGKSNRFTLPPNPNPTSKLGQEPNIPVDPAMLNQIQNDTVYGPYELPTVTVTGNKPTPEEEDARVQEQINMAENKGFYGGGTVRRKSYMNGGNVQLQALHNEMQALSARQNEMQALSARQNEIRNLINNQMFNSGQSQLPTEMQQPMPMQQPMARYGYQVKNGNLMNSYAKGGSFNNPGFKALPESVQQNIMTASQNKMAMGGAYDYYGNGGSYMDYNEGGEYYLSDDEIQAFLEAGGQLEIME